MRYKLVLTGILAFLVVVFIYQNNQPVTLRFLVWALDTSQVVLMLVMLLIGAVMSWLLGSYVRIRIRRQLKEK
ncbi:MAG: LapA family protein [Deltaproteobacteria bacterium]|jgi:uncharacterized integral membrane protein|nr:LapA family protein [Deltaproteobacteria bacterium]MBW2476283.1 LapA family protein [Deltaproteobacteria bacterium]MBW2519494.1 LapA family protein [Deltaproteobacteria bacterium]